MHGFGTAKSQMNCGKPYAMATATPENPPVGKVVVTNFFSVSGGPPVNIPRFNRDYPRGATLFSRQSFYIHI